MLEHWLIELIGHVSGLSDEQHGTDTVLCALWRCLIFRNPIVSVGRGVHTGAR
jgi:hypothetical protein